MVVRAIEVDKLAAAAGNLPVGGRQRRWGHLSLHVIDACLSATDPQLAAQACWGYAYSAGLRRVQVAAELIPLADEQDLRSFWRHCVTGRSGPHLHGQRGAVTRVAQVLIDHRLTDLGSVGSTCGDHDLLERISVELLDAFPLLNPQRWWRSVGDDCYIELDPPVRGWCTKVLGYPAPPQHLRDLLPGVAWTLGVTPWQLTATIRSAAQPAHEDVAPAEIDLATHLDRTESRTGTPTGVSWRRRG